MCDSVCGTVCYRDSSKKTGTHQPLAIGLGGHAGDDHDAAAAIKLARDSEFGLAMLKMMRISIECPGPVEVT